MYNDGHALWASVGHFQRLRLDKTFGVNTAFNAEVFVAPPHDQNVGNQDGQWDKTAWKTAAFKTATRLTGFTPPQ